MGAGVFREGRICRPFIFFTFLKKKFGNSKKRVTFVVPKGTTHIPTTPAAKLNNKNLVK